MKERLSLDANKRDGSALSFAFKVQNSGCDGEVPGSIASVYVQSCDVHNQGTISTDVRESEQINRIGGKLRVGEGLNCCICGNLLVFVERFRIEWDAYVQDRRDSFVQVKDGDPNQYRISVGANEGGELAHVSCRGNDDSCE